MCHFLELQTDRKSGIPRSACTGCVICATYGTWKVLSSCLTFSILLIKYIFQQLHHRSKVDVGLLHYQLLTSNAITETPIFGDLTGSQGPYLVLRPMRDPEIPILTRRPAAHLLLGVSLADDPTGLQIASWLKTNTPESVTAVTVEAVISRARVLQGCFDTDNYAKGYLLSRISRSARDEVLQKLRFLNGTMKQAQAFIEEDDLESCAPAALQNIQSATMALTDAVETPLLLDLGEPELAAVLSSSEAKYPDLDDCIRLHQQVKDLQATPGTLEIDHVSLKPIDSKLPSTGLRLCSLSGRLVVTEYISYDPNPETGDPFEQAYNQVVRVAAILRIPKRLSFRILPGAGFVQDTASSKIGMVFELPMEVQQPQELVLLDTLYKSLRRAELGHRAFLSYRLAAALDEIHRVGWLHKNVSSSSIAFITEKEIQQSILREPWLVGFEYCRPEDAETHMESDYRLQANLYRHPDRWGSPQSRFVRAHDVHSLVSSRLCR